MLGATNTNSIVIGASSIGLGSTTTVIGNSSTTQTKIFGSLTLPTALSVASGGTSTTTATGTGSVVLSDSPTLTGTVAANVNLRSDTLANLLPLAGGSSEIGYATDSKTLIRFNGVAGQAQSLGAYGSGGTLNFTITAANLANITNPASGVCIDVNNASDLWV